MTSRKQKVFTKLFLEKPLLDFVQWLYENQYLEVGEFGSQSGYQELINNPNRIVKEYLDSI